MLVDRTSIDIFGNEGRLYMPMAANIPANTTYLNISANGGNAKLTSLEVFELKSVWTEMS